MIIIWILILKFKLNKIYFIYIYCFLKFEIDSIINEEINKSDIFFFLVVNKEYGFDFYLSY